jgi:phospho-N-acetylmuramoyl-pentapeptide-transferase
MLYHLLYPLHTEISVFNVFRYITFRSAYAMVTALSSHFCSAPPFIRMLRRIQMFQVIREGRAEDAPGQAGHAHHGRLF